MRLCSRTSSWSIDRFPKPRTLTSSRLPRAKIIQDLGALLWFETILPPNLTNRRMWLTCEQKLRDSDNGENKAHETCEHDADVAACASSEHQHKSTDLDGWR